MAFKFTWPVFSEEFTESARSTVEQALNAGGSKPVSIVDTIYVKNLSLGTVVSVCVGRMRCWTIHGIHVAPMPLDGNGATYTYSSVVYSRRGMGATCVVLYGIYFKIRDFPTLSRLPVSLHSWRFWKSANLAMRNFVDFFSWSIQEMHISCCTRKSKPILFSPPRRHISAQSPDRRAFATNRHRQPVAL